MPRTAEPLLPGNGRPGNYYDATAGAGETHAPLSGVVEAETCIVGGGFAGLNTALGLAERGQDGVCLLEAKSLAFGASGRNGGFVFSGFSRGEAALLADLGPRRAKALHRGTRDAVGLIRERSQRYRIDCDRVDAPVLWANWFKDPSVLRERQALLRDHFDTHWHWVDRAALRTQLHTDRYSAALSEPGSFHFHPVKYARGVAMAARAMGVAVHEHSPALSLEREGSGWRVKTPEGEVRARNVVLACGGYLAGLRRDVDRGVMPIATYVMVTEPLGGRMAQVMSTRSAVYDTRFAFDYYRPLPDGRLLWGGRISIRDRDPAGVRRLLMRDVLRVFPQLKGVGVDFAWSGLMSYARHEMPQVGEIAPGLWLSQAFGGHGVGPTTFAGELVASGIAEGDSRWRELSDYGLVSAFKPVGLLAAQAAYWRAQMKDWWKASRE